MLAERYGLERYGRIGGVVALFTTVGRAAGPVLAALALCASGSYSLVLAGLALLLVAATALSLWPPAEHAHVALGTGYPLPRARSFHSR